MKHYNYRLSINIEGKFVVYANMPMYYGFGWIEIKTFDNRKDADEYFKSIEDLPKYK